jgi:sortase A
VIAPVPDDPGATPTEKLMTMTTCTPKFTASDRMIVHAVLTQTIAADGTAKPAAITALYAQGA